MFKTQTYLRAMVGLILVAVMAFTWLGAAYAQSPQGEGEADCGEQAAPSQDGGMMGRGGMGMMRQGDGGMMGRGGMGMMRQGDGGMMGRGGMGMMQQGDGGMMGRDGMDMMQQGDDGMMDDDAYGAPWGRSYWTISLDDVRRMATSFLADLDAKLTVGEVLDFGNHFYAEAVERDTRIGAYEMMIHVGRDSKGTFLPAKGPNRVWNVKYSTVGTDVRPEGDTVNAPEMTVSEVKALEYADLYLKANHPELALGVMARPFYGYYNVNVLEGGKVVGVVAVNGYNGRVWYYHSPASHAAHGDAAGGGEDHEVHHSEPASTPEPGVTSQTTLSSSHTM